MYKCYLCLKDFRSIAKLIWHMKIYHNLGNNSFYLCKQQYCARDFRGLKKFRQHLNREHFQVTVNQNYELNFSNTTTKSIVESSVELPDIFNKSSATFFELNSTPFTNNIESYELIEESVIINDLINNHTKQILDNENNLFPYDEILKRNVLQFITKLMSKPYLTNSLVQDVVESVMELFSSGIIEQLKCKVVPILQCDSSTKLEVEKMFDSLQDPFFELQTHYQRIKYLISNNLFFKPETVVVGHTKEKRYINGEDKLLTVPIHGHFLSMKKNLKAFFELPDVLKVATEFMHDSSLHNNTLTSFLDGSTWKDMKLKFSEKIVLPLFLYYDDAEMGNPLGSHSGIHKIGCIYYTVAALPPEYLSSLNNIFTAFLFHTSDRGTTKVPNKIMFSRLINELIDLQTNGISVCVDNAYTTIYFALGLVLGDNLGLNSILGFVESFSANYYCRICRSPKPELQKMLRESFQSLRNENNYEMDINTINATDTGLNERCIFHDVPNFHAVRNIVCDFMHDIPEGVARYDMAIIVQNLIINKYFTLDQLNSRIVLYQYGMTENKNCPPKINQSHLNNGSIIMSASEMLCLVRNFGLIVGELIPKSSKNWKLYILLRKIVDLCCARSIQPECSKLLDSLVSEHNRLYMELSNKTLKPKFHLLTHYGRLLLKNGPIKLTSSIRFEAKHKVLKSIANSVPCRINLGHTLTFKLQLQTVSRLLSKSGLDQDLQLGMGTNRIPATELPYSFISKLPNEFLSSVFNASWLQYKGQLYKKGMLMVINYNLCGCTFGKVMYMFSSKSKIPYFVLNRLITIGFDSHYYAYEIIKNENCSELEGFYINELPDSTPTVARILGNGKMYATLKYAL